MSRVKTSKPQATATTSKRTVARLFYLDLSGGHVMSANPDGSDKQTLVTECRLPDGIAVDVENGHIYWTNMGVPNLNDGSIERADLDGSNRRTIIAEGKTFTPKQLHLDRTTGKLYWCDREGMRVMRSNFDGSQHETLVDTSQGDVPPGPDQTKWCVGITVDPVRGHIYWTQKGPDNAGRGRIFRANIDIPKGQNAANRSDIELLFDNLPEPIDLELDLEGRVLYWTDRGNPPHGNTVNRASVDSKSNQSRAAEIVLTDLMEGIGLSLDIPGDQMYVTDLGGSVYSARLNGSGKRTLLYAQGNMAGIAYAQIPAQDL